MKRIRLPRIERDRALEALGFGVLAIAVGWGIAIPAGLAVAALALIFTSLTIGD